MSIRILVESVLVIAVVPRVAIFIWASWKLSRKHWWRYWITIDNVLLLTVVIAIVYGYMLLKLPIDTTPETAGALEWRIAAVVSLPIIMSAFNGNFRILVKMYPWTPLTIFIYKALRIYAVVVGTITQLELRTKTVTGMDLGILLLYITSQVSYHVSLLARIPSWTSWQRSMETRARAAKEAGVHLTLDEHAVASNPSKHASAIVNLSAGYGSYDDENEDALHYFQHGGAVGNDRTSLLDRHHHMDHPTDPLSPQSGKRRQGQQRRHLNGRGDDVPLKSDGNTSSSESLTSSTAGDHSDAPSPEPVPIDEQAIRGVLIDDDDDDDGTGDEGAYTPFEQVV